MGRQGSEGGGSGGRSEHQESMGEGTKKGSRDASRSRSPSAGMKSGSGSAQMASSSTTSPHPEALMLSSQELSAAQAPDHSTSSLLPSDLTSSNQQLSVTQTADRRRSTTSSPSNHLLLEPCDAITLPLILPAGLPSQGAGAHATSPVPSSTTCFDRSSGLPPQQPNLHLPTAAQGAGEEMQLFAGARPASATALAIVSLLPQASSPSGGSQGGGLDGNCSDRCDGPLKLQATKTAALGAAT